MDFYRRHELPETVRRYKTYTNQFQEWLIKAATSRQVELAQQISGPAKKGTRKKGHKMSIKQQEHLVDVITKSNDTLADTSGLLHLGDAIRSRKEIAQYYKLVNQEDEGHAYFNGSLGSFMATLSKFVPTFHKAQNLDDESSNFASNFFVINFSPKDSGEIDNDSEDEIQETPQAIVNRVRKPMPASAKSSKDVSLTQEERDIQQNFLILRFLYDFNLLRQIVRDVWHSYRRGHINAITAALVTDLAQSHIRQSIAGLVEDLGIAQGKLADAIGALYTKVNARSESGSHKAAKQELQEHVLRDVLCIESIKHIHDYLFVKDKNTNPSSQGAQSDRRVQIFLQFFATIRSQKIALPIWDTLTETVFLHATDSADWLPFGLQIILDIQGVVHDVNHILLTDITEHSLDLTRLMQIHIEYEDRMWAADKKPDYLIREHVKFSTIFLPQLDSMLAWIRRLLPSSGPAPNESQVTTDTFVTVHSTLAGLAMWQYNKQYHGTAIGKVQWFIIFLCHVYNAAQQLGGLEIAWPDLDFIIQAHGYGRIFIGAPPKRPDEFLDRYLLACGISAEYMAADYRTTGKSFCPRASHEVQQKRGLKPHFPLEEKITTYYGPDPDGDQWLKRHNIFHHLYHKTPNINDPSAPESEEALKQAKELQHTFSSISSHLCPPKSKNNRKKAMRVPVPDFSKFDETHASLFSQMKTELQSRELHNNFDYLSFYRHAYDFVFKIRGEVLLDNDLALARWSNIKKDPEPNHFSLLVDLFRSLQTQEQKPKAKTTGDEVSTDVVPLDQVKHIAKMMEGLIKEKGAIELGRAKMRMSRDWDGLKASYATEEAARNGAELEVSDVGHDDNHESDHRGAGIQGDNDISAAEQPHLKEVSEEVREQIDTRMTPEVDDIRAEGLDQKQCDQTAKEWNFDFPKNLSTKKLDITREIDCSVGDETESQFVADMKKMIAKHVNKGPKFHFGDEVKPMSEKQPTHQAYVADEGDEDGETKEVISSTTYLEDQDPLYKAKEHSDTTMTGKKRLSEAANASFQFRAVNGHSIQVGQDGYVDQVTKRVKVAKKAKRHTTSTLATYTKGIGKALQVLDSSSASAIPPPTSPLPSKPGSKSESKPKRSGYPQGIFHRFTFAHCAARKHVVTLQRSSTTARLTLTRKRPTHKKYFSANLQHGTRRHQRQFPVTTKKHSVVLPCYASCCMARALLNQQTKLSRRISSADTATGAKVWESESDRELE